MSARRERQLGLITPSMQKYDAEKAADWLDAVRRQICPFCGEGPFRIVAGHVSRVHGIKSRDLRDMIGVFYHESICDPFDSKKRSEIAKRVYEKNGIREKLRSGQVPGIKRSLSRAGKARNAEQARRIPDEQRRAAAKSAGAKRLAASADRDNEVLSLLAAGWRYKQINEKLGLCNETIRNIARRNGMSLDGRTRYHKSRRKPGGRAEKRELKNSRNLGNTHISG